MGFFYLNHCFDALEWKGTNAIINKFGPQVWQEKDVITLSDHSLILIHDPKIKDHVCSSKKFAQPIQDNTIVFFMSSQGVDFQPFNLIYEHDTQKKCSGCVFGIKKDGTQLTEEEITELIKWADQVSTSLKNETDLTIDDIIAKMPTIVKILLCPPDTNLLIALHILCQGYLVIHSDKENNAESVKKALIQIGWTKLSRDEKEKFSETTGYTMEERIKITEESKWWKDIFENITSDSISKQIQAEYGSELPTALIDLIDAIDKNKLNGKTAPDIVAQAYLCIRNKLKG
jgi:hypothetical protein